MNKEMFLINDYAAYNDGVQNNINQDRRILLINTYNAREYKIAMESSNYFYHTNFLCSIIVNKDEIKSIIKSLQEFIAEEV